MQSFFDLIGDTKGELNHFFKVTFRNSNNPNFRDMQPNIVMGINKNAIILQEESSRETIIRIQLDEIMNWGLNKDIFVVCYGDRFEMTKVYFQCYNPYEISELLFNYANQKVDQTGNMLDRYEKLDEFIINPKTRKVNVFNFK